VEPRPSHNFLISLSILAVLVTVGTLVRERTAASGFRGAMAHAKSLMSAPAATDCVPPPSQMVGWWPGDFDAKDIQGGNTATLQSGALFTTGKVSQAFHLDGVGDSISITDNTGALNITGNQVSIDAWIKLQNNQTTAQKFTAVIGKNVFSSGQPYQIVFESGPIAGNSLHTLPQNQWQLEYILTNAAGTRLHDQTTGIVITVDTVYHHFTMTYDGANVRLYVDGVLRYKRPFTGNLRANPTVPVVIGGGAPFAADEVEIFNRALTQTEIQSIVNADNSGKCKTQPTPTPTQTPTPTPGPSPIELLLEPSAPEPDLAVALDSSLLVRDPFPVVNPENVLNRGVDRNTRVAVFATNLQLAQGESAGAVVINLFDGNNQTYDLLAEDVRPVPNCDLTQVVFRLPDNLAAGTCNIKLKAHAQVSNFGTIRISPPADPPYFNMQQAFGLPAEGPIPVTLPDGTVITNGTDQLLVFLAFDATLANMQAVASALSNGNARVVGEIPLLHELQIQMRDVNRSATLLATLSGISGVLYAGPNLFAQPEQCSANGVHGTDWTAADNLFTASSANNVVIGIIDCFDLSKSSDGAGNTHGDLVEAFLKDSAGPTLAPKIVRISTDICDESDLHKVFRKLDTFVRNNPGKKVVINASLGPGAHSSIAEHMGLYFLFKYASLALMQQYGDRVIVVKSAGNDSHALPLDNRAMGCNFVTVGGLDQSTSTTATKLPISNSGPLISVFAPGCAVVPVSPAAGIGWLASGYSGTSEAAPQVAGQLAAIWEQHPSLSGCQVASQLNKLTIVPMVTGFRRFDGRQLEALAAALTTPTPIPTPTPSPTPTWTYCACFFDTSSPNVNNWVWRCHGTNESFTPGSLTSPWP
jgi:hypothetical protein